MKKRGLSHIEIILAFILFISSVIFIFNFFDINKNPQSSDSTLLYVSGQVKNEIETDLSVFSITLDQGAIGNAQSIAINLGEDFPENYDVRAEDYNGNPIPAKRGPVRTVLIDPSGGSQFLRIYASKEITSKDNVPVAADNPLFYQIRNIDNSTVISQKKAERLATSYNSNYISLKSKLNIPTNTNFAFEIKYEDNGQKLINGERDIPARAEVRAETKRYKMVYEDGRTGFVDFTIKVW